MSVNANRCGAQPKDTAVQPHEPERNCRLHRLYRIHEAEDIPPVGAAIAQEVCEWVAAEQKPHVVDHGHLVRLLAVRPPDQRRVVRQIEQEKQAKVQTR